MPIGEWGWYLNDKRPFINVFRKILYGTRAYLETDTDEMSVVKHYELISKYNVGLKTRLREGLSEPELYGDLVYKLKKLIGSNDFSFQFRKSLHLTDV